MNWRDVKKELLRNPRVAAEYEALEPEYELARSIIARRMAKGLTQRQLAARARTKQPAISRLESGTAKPSLSLLERVADALDATVTIRFEPRAARRQPARGRAARAGGRARLSARG